MTKQDVLQPVEGDTVLCCNKKLLQRLVIHQVASAPMPSDYGEGLPILRIGSRFQMFTVNHCIIKVVLIYMFVNMALHHLQSSLSSTQVSVSAEKCSLTPTLQYQSCLLFLDSGCPRFRRTLT